MVWGASVEALADGVDQLGGTFVRFHHGVGGIGATVRGSGYEGDRLDIGPTLVGEDQRLVAVLGGERVAENHDIDVGLGREQLDVSETGGCVHVEACPLEDERAGVDELVIAPKHQHGSGDRHRDYRAYGDTGWSTAGDVTVGLCAGFVCSLSNTPLFIRVPTG
jgi:hypothetical protein